MGFKRKRRVRVEQKPEYYDRVFSLTSYSGECCDVCNRCANKLGIPVDPWHEFYDITVESVE